MKLSSFWLKIIALIAMTTDHIGVVFFPGTTWMRLVGRLAMPIFCFLAAEGFRHTRSQKKYILRMFLLALLSAYPHFLAFGWPQNVLFSLSAGLLALFFLEKVGTRGKQIAVIILMCILSTLLLCDWYFVGVIFVVGFYDARGDKLKMAAVLLVGLLANLALMGGATLLLGNTDFLLMGIKQFAALASLPLLFLYSGKRGVRMKWSFYVYYPAHLLALWAAAQFLC